MPNALKNAQTKSPIIKNLVGGLNVREAITDIADNEAVTASNVVYYTAGSVVRRGGWQKLINNPPTNKPLLGTYQAVFNNAGVLAYYLIITDGAKIWQSSNPGAVGEAWTEITGGQALDASQPYHFLQMADKVVLYNGKAAFYWAGYTQALLTLSNAVNAPVMTITAIAFGAAGNNITVAVANGSVSGFKITVTSGVTVETYDNEASVVNAVAAINGQSALVSAIFITESTPANIGATNLAGGAGAPGNISAFPAPGSGQISVPLSRVAAKWQNYLFWGGDKNNPCRLYFSNLGDPTTYPSANFIDVPDPFDGDPIMGLAILYGNLIVFKRFSLYILQGSPPNNLILSKLNSSVGCVDPASVGQIDNLVYFVSDKGLYAANLFNVRQVCYKVEPRYTTAVPLSTPANPMWLANYRPRGQILMSANCRPLYATSIGKNDRLLVHDYFNADKNGDPAVSEFIVGFTHFGLAANKPAYWTAPSIMGDYQYTDGSKPVTVMASFGDNYVYAFTDSPLAYGGPTDQVSWIAEGYPPDDWMSKFFDFGDPDMIKIVRWLWTTGALYNSINLQAGIAYNNSPTVGSFVDFNTDVIELQASDGSYWGLRVDDDGALVLTKTTDTTFLKTLVLQDSNGQAWQVNIVIVAGNPVFDVVKTSSAPNPIPVLVSPTAYQYQLTVDVDGALDTVPAFAPDTVPIIPGKRVSVIPSVNGVPGLTQGKYVQFYFANIGVLTQFSADLIMKGRRN